MNSLTETHFFFFFGQTTKLTSELAHFNLGGDQLFLTNLTQTIFRGYLDSYINIESRFLNERCTQILQRYYASKGHQKKASASAASSSSVMNAGAEKLQDLKRDLHGFIASKANINIDTTVSYGGETFLSEEVCMTRNSC